MTLNRTVARFPFVVAAALVTLVSFNLTAPVGAVELASRAFPPDGVTP